MKKFLSYDWFKLIVTAILLIVITILLLRGCNTTAEEPTADQPETVVDENEADVSDEDTSSEDTAGLELDLPDFPKLAGDLSLNAKGDALLDADGRARYYLSPDGKQWLPVISDDIMTDLPEGAMPELDADGNWILKDAEGNALFQWNPETMQWESLVDEADMGIDLPDLPKFSDALSLSNDNFALVSDDGKMIYRLSADTKQWVPVIPDGIKAELSEGTMPELDADGNWVLKDADGNIRYQWNPETMQWESIPQYATLMQLPPFTDVLILDEANKVLMDKDGNIVYRLSEDGDVWTPVIPDDIKAELPEGTMPEFDADGNWVLKDTNGNVRYQWNFETMQWEAMQEEESSVEREAVDCPLVTPTQLLDAEKVVVASPLNLRVEPGIESGLIRALNTDTVATIIGGPHCQMNGTVANYWWQIELEDGTIGWSAEGSSLSERYYLKPAE